MKIIFLDVDGVLSKMGPNGNLGRYAVSRPLLRNLSYVIKSTNAKIVLSSDWRRFPEAKQRLTRLLRFKGLRIISSTPVLERPRIEEIKEWLSTTKLPVTEYLIIDDILVEEGQILCDPLEGLTEELAELAIERLGRVKAPR